MTTVGIEAKRLLSAMARQGLDQGGLARSLGVTQSAISKIILGRTKGSRLLPKIAAALDVSLAWLLNLSDDPIAAVALPADQQRASLKLLLLSESALAATFEGLLLKADRNLAADELSRKLAQELIAVIVRNENLHCES